MACLVYRAAMAGITRTVSLWCHNKTKWQLKPEGMLRSWVLRCGSMTTVHGNVPNLKKTQTHNNSKNLALHSYGSYCSFSSKLVVIQEITWFQKSLLFSEPSLMLSLLTLTFMSYHMLFISSPSFTYLITASVLIGNANWQPKPAWTFSFFFPVSSLTV